MLGLVNTYLGLILVYMILTLPLSVWMLTSYFKAIPIELEEAAIIDGASPPRRAVPHHAAAVAARHRGGRGLRLRHDLERVHLRPLLRARIRAVKTLPIGIAEFSTEFNTDWGAVMAASVVMTLPIALLFLAMQRLFIGGLTAGAVKG